MREVRCLINYKGVLIVRHWSLWDEQLLRALRSEFRSHSRILVFERGAEGGVAVYHDRKQMGLWVATGQHQFRYLAYDRQEALAEPCDIMDIIAVNYDLFSTILNNSNRDFA